MTGETAVEISNDEFRSAATRELVPVVGVGDAPLYWSFADTHYVACEDPRARVVTWCGKREASVWTWIERLDLNRSLGLDTIAALRGDDDYPHDMGNPWTREAFSTRIALEGRMFARHLHPALADDALFEDGGVVEPDAVALDDPEAVFVRACFDRFGFLEREHGLTRELDLMGSGVLYRGDPLAVRIALTETGYEHEEDVHLTVHAELVEAVEGVVPPLFWDGVELEIPDRRGAFSREYLDRSLAEVERKLRAELDVGARLG